MNLIEKPFERNPYNKDGKLTSTIGYMYGKCARQLYYSVETNKIAFTESEIEAMNNGTQKHIELQNSIFKDMLHEYHLDISIPDILGIKTIGATVDCISFDGATYTCDKCNKTFPNDYMYCPDCKSELQPTERIIELKPCYTRTAYYQTLIERFVFPHIPIFLYSYTENKIFGLKADYKMSIIYLGRIITAMNVKPPRPPFTKYSKSPCNKCMFRDRCYTENPPLDVFADSINDNKAQWETWKQYTNKPIQTLLNRFWN